jgi:hypothetical protein
VETLWREGRCTGREGNVRCEMTKEEYIVQVDGLVPRWVAPVEGKWRVEATPS